jgi:hypothetical protein
MADKNLLSQMLEHLVNEDQTKAEELFHEYVVAASREIYEGLIESELKDEEDEEDEDTVEEAAEEDEDKDDDDLDENFEDIAVEADDEMDMGSDPTDDLAGELDDSEEDEDGEEGEEQLFQDLEAIVDELQAKFDELKGDDHEEPDADNMGGPSDMDADNMMKDEFELETVREYVEKVGTPKGGDNGANAKSIVAGKNDMGGTTANIAKGGEAKGEGTAGGLLKPTTQPQDGGNINVPGGNAGKTAFKKKETAKGGDDGANTASLFRGRR